MKKTLSSLRSSAVLAAALAIPFAVGPTALRADDHRYHDAAHNDDHTWDSHEDRAYKTWAKENHRKAVSFSKLKNDDQQNYWNWRHDHSDDQLRNKH